MEAAKAAGGKTSRRISALVALTLLEVIRQQDLPTEVLESEDTSHTMPRRLGLSDVIDKQIRRYRDEVRKRQRITDDPSRGPLLAVLRRNGVLVEVASADIVRMKIVPTDRGGPLRIPRSLQSPGQPPGAADP